MSFLSAVWLKTQLREQIWRCSWWAPNIYFNFIIFNLILNPSVFCLVFLITIKTEVSFFLRVTHSSSDQKWRKWTLLAGCAKPWASTSPALPPAAPSDQAPTLPCHVSGPLCIHVHILYVYAQKLSHILALFSCCYSFKQFLFPLPSYFFTSSRAHWVIVL